ncbi:DsbC family protein [Halotalea alkalilenta]|uniref:DsbC family protein n=1 Tax=Halotalea alkalilenta TaxID=376489 RepID=UPI0009DEC5A9|nr:DsbC family protein [Halotalea alkalilenta]
MPFTSFAAPRRLFGRALLGTFALGASMAAVADAPPDGLERLTINGTEVAVRDARSTPIEGLYRLRLESGEVVFSDAQGRYMLVGDLYENGPSGLVNLSRQAENQERREALASLDEDDMVIFRPAGEVKSTLTVFTDTTCPYCHKLHAEVPELNQRGIAVRYLAFPRAGENSPGARQLAQVWCSDNRTEAMSAAVRGEELSASGGACVAQIERDYELGKRLGVQGTPAVVFPDGSIVPGYLPVDQLTQLIDARS